MAEHIRIVGAREDVVAITAQLEERFGDTVGIQIGRPEPHVERLFLRTPYRQNEIFDVVVTITTSLVPSVLYDELKTFARSLRLHNHVEVTEETDSATDKDTDC